MRAALAFIIAVGTGLVFGAEHGADRVRNVLKSDYYAVTWHKAPTYGPHAELEIGYGGGHGSTLTWMRFRSGHDAVHVLRIQFAEGLKPYQSKWPPDKASIVIEQARMRPQAYGALLHNLAVVHAATLEPTDGQAYGSSGSFWVYARLAADRKALVDLDWASYDGSCNQLRYAKPKAAVTLACKAVNGLQFKTHSLTQQERRWAGLKLARDWKKFKRADEEDGGNGNPGGGVDKLKLPGFHWWVRERYIVLIGYIGDQTALPTLRGVLQGDPKDRLVYYAINAITRLVNDDVRTKPVEEMDVDRTRRKVLKMLHDSKGMCQDKPREKGSVPAVGSADVGPDNLAPAELGSGRLGLRGRIAQ